MSHHLQDQIRPFGRQLLQHRLRLRGRRRAVRGAEGARGAQLAAEGVGLHRDDVPGTPRGFGRQKHIVNS